MPAAKLGAGCAETIVSTVDSVQATGERRNLALARETIVIVDEYRSVMVSRDGGMGMSWVRGDRCTCDQRLMGGDCRSSGTVSSRTLPRAPSGVTVCATTTSAATRETTASVTTATPSSGVSSATRTTASAPVRGRGHRRRGDRGNSERQSSNANREFRRHVGPR